MSLSEFELIERYFTRPARGDVALGVGDDCALLRVPPSMELAVSTDTLVSGVHFAQDVDPYDLGWKAMAVNLSDLAAMGAAPRWATLALTLPEARETWLEAFSRGLFALAQQFDIELVGGDTTRGPLSVTLQVLGLVPAGEALRRSGARPGDLIYVTGVLGEAALALALRQGRLQLPAARLGDLAVHLDRPQPRVREGLALRGVAHAAIDVSDGLAADLGHMLSASGVGATLHLERLPVPTALAAGGPLAWDLALGGGDDYELCFTVPPAREAALHARLAPLSCPLSRIGGIHAGAGLRCVGPDGSLYRGSAYGYRHFP